MTEIDPSSHRLRNLLLAALLFLLVLPGSAVLAAELAPASSSRSAIETRALADLVASRDAGAALAELRALDAARPPPPKAGSQAPATSDAERFALALAMLRSALRPLLADNGADPAAARVLAGLLRNLEVELLLYRDRFEAIEQAIDRVQAGAARTRFAAFRSAFEQRWDARLATLPLLQAELARLAAGTEAHLLPLDPAARAGFEALQAELQRGQSGAGSEPAALLGARLLPQQRPGLAAPLLPEGPGITPSYARGETEVLPEAADLAPDADAQAADPVIQAQVDALGRDPVQVFDFVRSQIDFEPYPGSRKSAVQVLATRAGNDIDQAHLLVALLRAMRLPARYVRGVLEVPAGQLAQLYGVPETALGRALQSAGTPHAPVLQGGRIQAWRIEHTWVATRVPYGNARGTPVDDSAPIWLPLAPALKIYGRTPSSGLLARAGIQGGAWVNAWLATPPAASGALPLAALRTQLQAWLATQSPAPAYDTQLAQRALDTAPLGLLPAGLPVATVAVHAETPALPPERRQRLRLRLHATAESTSPLLLDLELPLRELLNQRVTLGYAPATVDDAHLLNARGGLAEVPAFLPRLRAELRIGGRSVAQGSAALEPGQLQRLDLALVSPAGTIELDQLLRAGGLHALLFSEPGHAPPLPDEPDPAEPAATSGLDDETPAARVLWNFAARYAASVDRDADELARLAGIQPIAPWPSISLVLGQFSAIEVQGLTERLQFDGIALDAALRAIEPIAADSSDLAAISRAESDYLHLLGLQASALEAAAFESQWSVPASSADRLLQQASAQSIERLHYAPGQPTTGLAHPAAVRESIDSWLQRGWHVEIPRTALVAEDWSGSGWRVFKPGTGESGWFVSGGYAGGVTIPRPEFWTLQQLAALLGNPLGLATNTDPQDLALLVIDEESNEQTGIAGMALAKPLAVYALDAGGRPIQGVRVEFEVMLGNARLGEDAMRMVAISDNHGRASVPVKMDNKVGAHGFDVMPDGGTEPEFRGVTLVRPTAIARGKTYRTGRDLQVLAKAGAPAVLETVFGADTLRYDPEPDALLYYLPGQLGYRPLYVSVIDAHGNNVANVPFGISATQVPLNDCPLNSAPPRFFLPGSCPEKLRFENDCGVESGQFSSRTRPLPVMVLPQTGFGVRGSIHVDVPGIERKSYDWIDPGRSSGECGFPLTGRPSYRWVVSSFGNNTYMADTSIIPHYQLLFGLPLTMWTAQVSAAAAPGEWLRQPLRFSFMEFDFASGRFRTPQSVVREHCEWDRTRLELACTIGSPTYAPYAPFGYDGYMGDPVLSGSDIFVPVRVPAWPSKMFAFIKVLVDGREAYLYADAYAAQSFIETMPRHIPVSSASVTLSDLVARVDIRPVDRIDPISRHYRRIVPGYQGISGRYVLTADGEPLTDQTVIAPSGVSTHVLPRGVRLDPAKTYRSKYVLNPGTPYEIESESQILEFDHGVITGMIPLTEEDEGLPPAALQLLVDGKFESSFRLESSVDLPRQKLCERDREFAFALAVPARVELSIQPLIRRDGQQVEFGQAQVLFAEFLGAGTHKRPLRARDIAPGTYRLVLSAVETADPSNRDTRNGSLSHDYRIDNGRSFGQSMVKSVNVFDGSYSVSRRDFSVPGRGPELAFERSYSSAQAQSSGLGYLGWGWNSMLQQAVVPGMCDEVLVTGVDGGAQSFVLDRQENGIAHYRGTDGAHGTLQYDLADPRWTYFALDGTRYDFSEFRLNPRARGVRLTSITDTSGQQLQLSHGLVGPAHARNIVLQRVASSDGRWIELDYEEKRIRYTEAGGGTDQQPLWMLVAARSSSADEAAYHYDDFGNLVSFQLQRGGAAPDAAGPGESYGHADLGGESYTSAGRPHFVYHGWKLTSTLDNRNGASRAWSYVREFAELQGPENDVRRFPQHRVVDFTEADRGSWKFTYTGIRGRAAPQTEIQDALSRRTHYSMDQYGAVLEQVDPAGTVRTTWNVEHRKPASRTNRLGQVTNWTYDVYGNTLSETLTGPGSLSRTWTYHPPAAFDPPVIKNRVATATDARGIVTTHVYDLQGRPTSITRGGVTQTLAYAANGDLVSSTNGAGERVEYIYDMHGLPIQEIHPLGAMRTYAYDAQGRRIRSVDARGVETTMEYDGFDRITRITDPIGTKQILHGGRGRKETDENQNSVDYTFDALDRVLELDRHYGVSQSWKYDLNGNLTEEIDPRGAVTKHTYDAANRRIRTDAPEGRRTTFTHDAEGHVLSETTTGPGGTRSTSTEYAHPLYLPTRISRSGLATEILSYDGNGNLTQRVDPRGAATTQTFDDRDRLVRRVEPEGRITTWAHDGADRPTRETHASGWSRSTSYNALGQAVQVIDGEGKDWMRSYDLEGNVLSETDRRGATRNWTYDARGRKRSESGPLPDQQMAWTFDAVGNVLSESYANGRVVTHEYDELNRRTSSRDDYGMLERLEYDPSGNVTERSDAAQRVTHFDYDDLNRRIAQTAPLGRTTRWTYTAWGEVLSETLPEGGVTTHEYDGLGRRTRTTLPLTHSDGGGAPYLAWSFDPNGNVLSQRDGRGLVTTFAYDDLNRRTTQTDPAPLAYTQSWTYDTAGNVRIATDRNGIAELHTYDSENRRLTTIRDLWNRETLAYDGEGGLLARTDGLGRTINFVLDAAGRTTELRLPEGIVRKTSYTPLGDVASVDDGTGRITTYDYDLRRRKTTETNAAGEATRMAYDALDQLRLLAMPAYTGTLPNIPEDCAFPNGGATHLTIYCQDAANRLIGVIDAERNRTSYEYDRNDNLVAIVDARANRAEFQYDARNRRIGKKSPPLATGPPQAWSWTYDPNGSELTRTDPVGTVATHSYDALNRRTLTTWTGAPAGSPSERSATFDPNGNLLGLSEKVGSASSTVAFEYDTLNRPTRITDPNGRAWTQVFDPADQRTQLASSSVPQVDWEYDDAGRATGITVEGAGSFTLGYDDADRNTQIAHPNGATTTHEFDDAGRIGLIEHQINGGTIARFQYGYDRNGNRTSQVEQNGATPIQSSFGYDHADRLVSITEPGKHTTYVLDPIGNRIESKEGPTAGQVTTRYTSTFDARNQIVEQKEYGGAGANVLAATTAFTFDLNGNLRRQARGSATTDYRYDALDRLVEITPPTGPPTQYRYGPGDVRTVTVRAGTEIRHHYDGERLILESNVLGNPQKHYAYTAAGLLSSAILGGTNQHRSAHLDAQTSPIAITASNSTVLQRSRFDPYGDETNLFGGRDQAISFQGYWSGIELEETGTLLSAARLYLPGLGVFGEIDPVEGDSKAPISFNAYLIGRSNPQRWLDPDGRLPAILALPAAYAQREAIVATISAFGRGVASRVTTDTIAKAAVVGVLAYRINSDAQALGALVDGYLAAHGSSNDLDQHSRLYTSSSDPDAHPFIAQSPQPTILSTPPYDGNFDRHHTGHQDVGGLTELDRHLYPGREPILAEAWATPGEIPDLSELDKLGGGRPDVGWVDQPMLAEANDSPTAVSESTQGIIENNSIGIKPRNSPDLAKWIRKGGCIWCESDGTWVYQDQDGNVVRYPDGYPDFRGGGFVRQSADIDTVPNHTTDFVEADKVAPLGAKLPENTWHHHQNTVTMEEVNKIIHSRFTHRGGVSTKKKGQ